MSILKGKPRIIHKCLKLDLVRQSSPWQTNQTIMLAIVFSTFCFCLEKESIKAAPCSFAQKSKPLTKRYYGRNGSAIECSFSIMPTCWLTYEHWMLFWCNTLFFIMASRICIVLADAGNKTTFAPDEQARSSVRNPEAHVISLLRITTSWLLYRSWNLRNKKREREKFD